MFATTNAYYPADLDDGNRGARRFAAWLGTAAGRRLLTAERPLLQEAARRFHGDAILWVGTVPDLLDTTDRCMVRKRFFASGDRIRREDTRDEQAAADAASSWREFKTVAADPAQLPLPAACVDGVVLHHALETSLDRRGALREAARVLRPGGRLLILGINPLSLWLLAKPGAAFRHMKPVSVPRLHDWLALLGLEQDAKTVYLNYRSVLPLTLRGTQWRRASAWLNKTQAPVGGVYLVAAVKVGHGFIGAHRRGDEKRLSANPGALAHPTRQVARTSSR